MQACLALCDAMDYTCQAPPSVGVPRQEYWSGFISFSRGFSQSRDIRFLRQCMVVKFLPPLSHLGTFKVPNPSLPPEFRMVYVCMFAILPCIFRNSSCSCGSLYTSNKFNFLLLICLMSFSLPSQKGEEGKGQNSPPPQVHWY